MTVQDRPVEGHETVNKSATECRFCGAEIGDGEGYATHLRHHCEVVE